MYRYSRLFSLGENLHTDGLPVVISAGALLKDNSTGKVLAQLKFRNISNITIKSVTVKINAFGTDGSSLEGLDNFSYLDLNAQNGETFGQTVPVFLPDSTTRAFSVAVLSVVSTDGQVFTTNGEVVTPASDEVEKNILAMDYAIAEAKQKVLAEKAEKDACNRKQKKLMIGLSMIPLACAVIGLLLFSDRFVTFSAMLTNCKTMIIFALFTPVLCILISCLATNNKKRLMISGAFFILLFVIQLTCALIFDGPIDPEMFFIRNEMSRLIPGCMLFDWLQRFPSTTRALSQILFFLNNFSAILIMFFGASKTE